VTRISGVIIKKIARNIPGLEVKLKQAGMTETPEEFIKKTLFTAFYLTTGIMIIMWAFLVQLHVVISFLYFLTPVLFILIFLYFLKLPDVKIIQKDREINKEIVYVGRFLIIELESGVSLYNAIANVSKNYPSIGKYFDEIINKVAMGTSLEDAISETIEYTPSPNFRKILWQILNSLKTGSDVIKSLNAVVEQIVKEQIIEVKQYSKKLNPLAMFYMMIAVILPTLGTTMLIILSTFMSINIDIWTLISIVFFLGFAQLMFFSIIKSSRPAVEL